jgi:hypothetical protein
VRRQIPQRLKSGGPGVPSSGNEAPSARDFSPVAFASAPPSPAQDEVLAPGSARRVDPTRALFLRAQD